LTSLLLALRDRQADLPPQVLHYIHLDFPDYKVCSVLVQETDQVFKFCSLINICFFLKVQKNFQQKLLLNAYLVLRYEKALNKIALRKQLLSVSEYLNKNPQVVKKLVLQVLAFLMLKGEKS
jgi:hypothetical protein